MPVVAKAAGTLWLASIVGAVVSLAAEPASATIPVSEHDALEAFYNSTNGPGWLNKTNWLGVAGTECTWYGVTCDAGELHVMGLSLVSNQLSGTIPPELGNLSALTHLELDFNQLSGTIPPELGNLSALTALWMSGNQLSGTIPPELGNLTNLTSLYLGINRLSGAIPPDLGDLSALRCLSLEENELSGAIPPALGSLSALQLLNLYWNDLSGTIPPELGNLSALQRLTLDSNHLSGAVPAALGNLTNLQFLGLYSNQLSGAIPGSLVNLTALAAGHGLSLSFNALYSSDPSVVAFVDSKEWNSNWQSTQTIAPTGLSACLASPTSAALFWTPITYTGDTGGYRVLSSATSGGPYTLATTTANKSDRGATVDGLAPGTIYFVLETLTNPHQLNRNTVISERTAEIAATTSCPSLSIDDITVAEGDSGTTNR